MRKDKDWVQKLCSEVEAPIDPNMKLNMEASIHVSPKIMEIAITKRKTKNLLKKNKYLLIRNKTK